MITVEKSQIEQAISYMKSEKAKHTKPFEGIYDLAVFALEKQVAKKFNNDCPNCSFDVFMVSDCGELLYLKYCPECGQKLDWSGDNAND